MHAATGRAGEMIGAAQAYCAAAAMAGADGPVPRSRAEAVERIAEAKSFATR